MMWEKPSQCDLRQKCLTPAQLSCLCTYGDAVHRSNYGAFAGQVTGVDGEIKSIKKAQFKTIFSVFTPWGLQPNTKVIQKINVDHPGINPRARQSRSNCWRAIRLHNTFTHTSWRETGRRDANFISLSPSSPPESRSSEAPFRSSNLLYHFLSFNPFFSPANSHLFISPLISLPLFIAG